jgi:uncharacterized protein (TIGR02646 family)
LNSRASNDKEGIKDAEKKYNHSEVKQALEEMFQGKCAYCEAVISHVSYGDIEHFRPKSKFPEKCFEWDNLLLACSICNGKQQKGDNFPEATDDGPLVNPVDEDPEDFFSFDYNPATQLAEINWKNQRGETSAKIYGLNREKLIRHRSEIVIRLLFLAKKATNGDEEAKNLLLKACQADAEYAAFGRMIADLIKLDWRNI